MNNNKANAVKVPARTNCDIKPAPFGRGLVYCSFHDQTMRKGSPCPHAGNPIGGGRRHNDN